MLILVQTLLKTSLDALHSRKIHHDEFSSDSGPLFDELIAICRRRSQISDEVRFIATVQNLLWTTIREKYVSLAHLQAQLSKYDGLEARVEETRTDQTRILKALDVRLYCECF